jgi:hemolysin III
LITAEELRLDQAPDVRPILRGALHLAVAMLAPAGLVMLLLISDSPRDYVGAAVFATSLCALYTTSASYHLIRWPARPRGIMKRLDHSMIFVLIAGTYTPFCLLVVGQVWGIVMLSVVWSIAGFGVVLKTLWPWAPRWLGVALYLGLGWVGVVAATEVVTHMRGYELAMLLTGGALYSVGSLVYAMRRPDPFPRVFGYHEVFHLLVVGGTAVHFVLIAAFVLPA